jgi:hypothetical protein
VLAFRRYTVSRFRSVPQSARSPFWKFLFSLMNGVLKPEAFYWNQIQIHCVGGL